MTANEHAESLEQELKAALPDFGTVEVQWVDQKRAHGFFFPNGFYGLWCRKDDFWLSDIIGPEDILRSHIRARYVKSILARVKREKARGDLQ